MVKDGPCLELPGAYIFGSVVRDEVEVRAFDCDSDRLSNDVSLVDQPRVTVTLRTFLIRPPGLNVPWSLPWLFKPVVI